MAAPNSKNWLTNLVAAGVAGGISIAGTSVRISDDVDRINHKLDTMQTESRTSGERLARIEVRLDQVEKRTR